MASDALPLSARRRAALADEMERTLSEQVLRAWYPHAIDREYGGFLTDLSYAWEATGAQRKMIVTQARHVWAASRAAERYGESPVYAEASDHGFAFLRDVLFDRQHGGFRALVTRTGEPVEEGDDPWLAKTAYGQAFAVFALAARYRACGDTEALDLARDTFLWLEERGSCDSVRGGYFEWLRADGTPYAEGYMGMPPKSQNGSIHLLEAFAELHAVWPDPLLRRRLRELLVLVRDTIAAPDGYLRLFFEADWTPVSCGDAGNRELDHISFGHDVEAAFLLLDAERALGVVDPRTAACARRLVDHALRWGWDGEAGGFFDRGYRCEASTQPTVIARTKVWWAQAEALNALLLMAERFPAALYARAFEQLWDYVGEFLVDHLHGGWYGGGVDCEPERRWGPKAEIWKGPYHTVRSLTRCIDRLRAPGT